MKSTEVLSNLTTNFLPELSDKDLKRIKKKLKESRKEIVNGRKKNFFLTEYVPIEYVVQFSMLQNDYFKLKFNEERKSSSDFLYDNDNLLKYCFYSESYEQKIRAKISLSLDTDGSFLEERKAYKTGGLLQTDVLKENEKFPNTFNLDEFVEKKMDKFRAKQLKKETLRIMPNQTPELLSEWTEQAFPSIQEELWDLEVEEALIYLIVA